MKRDVIYIDTDDDITSIINKVKAAEPQVVALVPPKRTGVLQSAVNLKLLQKAAHGASKKLVLVTHDKSLKALAAGMQIPIAKNLHSQPEMPEAPAAEAEEDDVIRGEELPVGELAETDQPKKPAPINDSNIVLPPSLENDGKLPQDDSAKGAAGKAKNRIKIPNFSSFRKRLVFIIIGVILLIAFLIWAIFFAPHATVNIKAKTDKINVNLPVSLQPKGTTDPNSNVIQPTVQEISKTNSVDFAATGHKTVGQKASGQVTISNCDTSYSQTVSAGETVISGGHNYILQSSASVPGGTFSGGGCSQPGQSGSVPVQAQNVGSDYNLSNGSSLSVAGHNSNFTAAVSSAITGGSKKQLTIVSQSDVDQAKQKLTNQDKDSARQELIGKFDKNADIIISDSFKAQAGTPSVNPGVGQEASQATLTAETTYTLTAISKNDAKAVLHHYLQSKIKGEKDRAIYDNGENDLKFSQYNLMF